jgi:uncharacterized membrane protein AbrB (regulator of aidB expression)
MEWWAAIGVVGHTILYAWSGSFGLGIGWAMYLLTLPLAAMLGPIVILVEGVCFYITDGWDRGRSR